MRVDAFDFDLPDELIALRPASPRDAARLLTVKPGAATPFADHRFSDLADLLGPGDGLVFNDTRVLRAHLQGVRARAGGEGARVSVNLIERLDGSRWRVLARPARRLREGDVIHFGGRGEACYADTLDARVEDCGEGGEVTVSFAFTGPVLDAAIAAHGDMPLPPYIAARRPADERDATDYQTVYARAEGSVAAPTAGLHFTEALVDALKARGVETCEVTLHVGAGTFLPVKCEDSDDHVMHGEFGEVSGEAAARLNRWRGEGRRIVAVGTTAARLLETAVDENGKFHAFSDTTDIFITPGFTFRAVDALVTNFHLPRSTLFMLVAAFCGLETMRAAYAHAIARGYRFYSYGDACLLEPEA